MVGLATPDSSGFSTQPLTVVYEALPTPQLTE